MKKLGYVLNSFLALSMLLQLSSCNMKSGVSKSSKDMNKFSLAEDDMEKMASVTYLAILKPINENVAGRISGSFTFHKDLDFIVSDIRVIGSAPSVIHGQNVYLGSSCPSQGADINEDGIIDILEAQTSTGKIILPLDADINNQYSLLAMYPFSDEWGAYFFSQIASFQKFFDDLKAEDENPTDEIVKLSSPTFGLEGKVVMIHGMADEVLLPESVATNEGLTAQQTIPVACGVITRVTIVPGSFEPDDVTIGTIDNGHSNPSNRPGNGSRPSTNGPGLNTTSGSNGGRTSPNRQRGGTSGSGSGTTYQGQCPDNSGKGC